MNPSTHTIPLDRLRAELDEAIANVTDDIDFKVGDLVEIHAEPCRPPLQCGPDCGCLELAARNGHVGAILNVQHPLSRFPGAEPYYQVDGIDMVLSAAEFRAVQS